jgi:hypothetical protein
VSRYWSSLKFFVLLQEDSNRIKAIRAMSENGKCAFNVC